MSKVCETFIRRNGRYRRKETATSNKAECASASNKILARKAGMRHATKTTRRAKKELDYTTEARHHAIAHCKRTTGILGGCTK
jgi:hypothetical protein